MPFQFRSIPITTSATPDYSAGDNVGGTFTINPQTMPNHGIKIQDLTLVDISNVGPALRIFFFHTLPTGTYTDNAALDLSATDATYLIGQVKIASTDWETTDSYKIVSVSGLQMIAGPGSVRTVGGQVDRTIYGAIVADGAWNAASTADLTLQVGFED